MPDIVENVKDEVEKIEGVGAVEDAPSEVVSTEAEKSTGMVEEIPSVVETVEETPAETPTETSAETPSEIPAETPIEPGGASYWHDNH